jgi:hypothetical protein
VIVLPAYSDREREVWSTLLDIADREQRWTVVGARMVELHLVERGRALRRSSLDGDALADARARPNPIRRIAQLLTAAGFDLEGMAVMGTGHTFVKGGVEIDLLAPENLGANSERDRTTIPPLHTVEVPGGRQALGRTEWVEVEVAGRRGRLPRPNLLGAILLKARAVDVDDVAESQRGDLAQLLSLVDDPDELAMQLRAREHLWLRRRAEMNDVTADCWIGSTPADAQRGLAALRVMARTESPRST